jgi:two-component sensor histidine kinase
MASRLADVASGTKPSIEPGDAAAEANHRIANNLAIIAEYVRSELLSLDQEKTADFQSIRRSLQHLSLRIDAIGRLHRLLTSSSPEDGVEISAYLREIAGAAQCSLAPDERIKILFLFDAEALVTAKQAVAIGAIASEAVVNSIKHSHPANEPGVISIGCKRIRCDGLLIEIKDDGVGRLQEHPGKQWGGAGSDLMRAFAHSLNATLEFVDGHPGHIVRFELPLSDQRPQ